jgi:hypothetical protein
MMFRPSHVVIGALALIAAACSDDNNFVQVASTAAVRLVNDTDTPISITTATAPESAKTTLNFGQASVCVLFQPSINTAPQLTVKNGVTGASITVIPVLNPGDNLTVVAFGGASGNIQFATLDNRFVPATNGAGLRFFNGVSSASQLIMERRGVLSPLVAFGAASAFVSVAIDSVTTVFVDRNSVVLDAGLTAFPQGQNSTLVVGPPAAGTVNLRFFTVQGC